MIKLLSLMLVVLLLSCNDAANTNTTNIADSPYKSIDSSAIINDSSKLHDSTNVGVQH